MRTTRTNIDTQFLGRAEGSFQDGRSKIKLIFCNQQQNLRQENNIDFELRI